MIYSNPVKEESHLKWAAKNNIPITTADTIEELEKIKKLAPNMKILWRISIKEENAENLATAFSVKFGDDILSIKDAENRFKQIADLGVNLSGIHFHCGSGKYGSSNFQKAIEVAKASIKIGRKYGHSMEILDLGGGFPAGDLTP